MKIFARRIQARMSYMVGSRRKIHIFIILFICMVALIAFGLNRAFMPAALSFAQDKTNRIGTSIINEAIVARLDQDQITYNSLCTLQKNEAGEITAINTNVMEMNRLKSQLALDIQERLEQVDKSDISIPIGTLMNHVLLEGRGPNIPVRLAVSGQIEMDFNSTFETAGINQTKHSISISVKTTVNTLLPGGETSSVIETTVPVAETVIVGTVPGVYANLGTSGLQLLPSGQ